jgi:hypothetical protein
VRTAVAAFLAWLPFDPRSRRALDETIADWTHEQGEADTGVRRGLVCARALIGVARAVVQTIACEVVRIPAGWLATRLMLVMAAPAVLLAVLGWGHVPAPNAMSWDSWFELGILVLPQALMATLPMALFAVVACSYRHRTVPALGLALVVLLSMLALGAWVLPVANRDYHVAAYSLRSNSDPAAAALRLPLAPNDLPPLDLAVSAASRPAGPHMGVLLFKTGLAMMAAAFVLLGAAVAQVSRSVRRSWIALIVPAYCLGLALVPSSWELGGHAPAFVGLIPWCAAGCALACSVSLQRTQQPEERTS